MNFSRSLSLFLLAAVSAISARPYLKIQQVRAMEYPYVKVELSVSKITPIRNLNETNFKVFENGWHVPSFQIKPSNSAADPKHIVLLVDSSRSISLKRFKQQITAVKVFIDNKNSHDKIAVLSFDDRVNNHCGFTDAADQLAQCVNSIARRGRKTVLFDAILEAVSVSRKLKTKRTSVLVFTDGRDEGSVIHIEDLINLTDKTTVPVFVAGTGDKQKLRKIARLTRLSGGETYHTASVDDVKRIYLLLNQLLDNTYLLQYVSQAGKTTKDGKRANIEIHLQGTGDAGSKPENTFNDQDSYTFLLPESFYSTWYLRLWQDERYLLFASGLVIIILLIVLLVAISRRSQVNVNVGSDLPAERAEAEFEPAEEKKNIGGYFPPKKSITDRAKVPVEYFHAYLVEKEGPGTGTRHKIRWNKVTLGHGDENSVVLNDSTVSFRHAKIERRSDKFILFDLLSEHGTYLNGKKLLRPKELQDFDELQLGRTRLIFRRASAPF